MNNELAKIIIEYREKNKISQRELAKRLEVDNAYITRIEKGVIKKVSINLLYKISQELKINFFDLLIISKYSTEELEMNGMLNNINDIYKFVNGDLIERYSIKDEYDNKRISVIKILNGYKKEEISEKETLGLLSCLFGKNIYNYLTEEETNKIKDVEQYRDII